MFIDTHCHIFLQEFDPDRAEMINRAENEGVTQFLMPAIDSETHEHLFSVENQYPGKCLAMMGLHPCSVGNEYLQELTIVEDKLKKRDFVAVGEIGLDFYWDTSFSKEQVIVFEKQIDLALHYDLPIVIHSRNSIDECIRIVKEKQNGKLRGVFHCFSGNRKQAEEIIETGFYLGIGGVITFKNSGLDQVIQDIDLSHIVLETDSPYLAPVPFRGKRNECSYLKYIIEKLSEIKKTSIKEVEKITLNNSKELFSI